VALIPDSEFASLRADLEIMFTHRYRRTRLATGGGVEDDWGDTVPVPQGSPSDAVPCLYASVDRAVRDEAGVSVVSVPTLSVSATDPLAVGDEIDAVTDQLGGVLLAGPLRVDRLVDDTAGLGASLMKVYELRSARAAQ
jgi:hypothetical protein